MRADQKNRLTHKYAGLRDHSGRHAVKVKIVRTCDDAFGDPWFGRPGVGDHDVNAGFHEVSTPRAADQLGADAEPRGPFDKSVNVFGKIAVFQVGGPGAGVLDEKPEADSDGRAGVERQLTGVTARRVGASPDRCVRPAHDAPRVHTLSSP